LRNAEALKNFDGISRAAAESGLPILIHIAFTDEEIEAFFQIAAAHPKTTYIVAHQLGPKMTALKRAPLNIYIDISGLTLAPRSAAPGFVALWRSIGMKRILLGSDWPLLHPSEYVAALRSFPLTSEERRLIIMDNALRLFP
jgi:predicted TIM-barrel fold metal-dependent hydrolase